MSRKKFVEKAAPGPLLQMKAVSLSCPFWIKPTTTLPSSLTSRAVKFPFLLSPSGPSPIGVTPLPSRQIQAGA